LCDPGKAVGHGLIVLASTDALIQSVKRVCGKGYGSRSALQIHSP
jgi:hypothetical protein